MAVQTVDNTNIAEFLEKGSVPAFVPPTEVKPGEVKPEAAKADDAVKAEVDAKAEAPKGEDEDADLPERVRKVVNKKHREMKEAEEYAESQYRERKAADKRADALQAELEAERAKSRPAPVEEKEPEQKDFETVGEYAKALAKHLAKQEMRAEREAQAKAQFVDQQTRIDTEFAKRVETARAEIDDYEDVVAKADRNVPHHIWNFMRESESGALLGYHFAKHPDVLDRIEKLSPIRALAELGKLETTLEKPKSEPPPAEIKPNLASISKAPAPIKPIEGNSEPVNLDLNRDMPYSEFKRLKKLKEQGRG